MTVLHAIPRTEHGRFARRLRASGKIPAILYGRGVEPTPLTVEHKEFIRAYEEAGASTLIDVLVGERTSKVLFAEVQRDPVSGAIIHADFRAVRMDEKLRTKIPFAFVGEAPAVKELGGTLVKNMDEIQVECLPGDLVHEISVDLGALKAFGDTVRIRDLVLPTGVVALHTGDEAIASAEAALSEEEMKRELESVTTVDVSQIEVAGKKEKEQEGTESAEEEKEEKKKEEKKGE